MYFAHGGFTKFSRSCKNIQVLLADLKTCSKTRDLERGKQCHAEAVESGHDSNIYVANSLINMYAKCRSIMNARKVFDNIKDPNVVSWNTLILGYAENGQGLTAFDLFRRIRSGGAEPNNITFLAVLKACTSLALEGTIAKAECLQQAKEIQKLAMENGSDPDIYVQCTLIDVYAKCGSMVDASRVFDSTKHPNVVSWNVLIHGYVENGHGLAALKLFARMRSGGPDPNLVTFIGALKACASLAVGGAKGRAECRQRGKEIHDFAVATGHSDIYLQSTLIDMYAKCGSMEDARYVFDHLKEPDVVSWTALILGYAENGKCHIALDLFKRMKRGKPGPNRITFLAVLKACSSLALKEGATECREHGKEIHDLLVESGEESDVHVQNTLMDMYAKCGCMKDARQVFEIMRHPDVVSWNVLIMGYVENGQGGTALDMYTKMTVGGPAANSITLLAALKACGLVGDLVSGRKIHSEIERRNELDVLLVTCLVDFYAKCGSLMEAQRVFYLYGKTRNRITWNALLAGLSTSGDHENVFRLFEEMQDAGFRPDSTSFLSILTCCNHAGLVEKGKECFDAMSTKYGVIRTVEHYTCILDVLGRANKIDDAMALLNRMSCNPNDVTWMTIMGACHKWKNVKIEKLAFQSLQEQEAMMGMRKQLRAWKKNGIVNSCL